MSKIINQQDACDLRLRRRHRRVPVIEGRGAAQDRPRILAPGCRTSTRAGSLYDTLLRAMAMLSNLPLHSFHFAAFQRTPGAAAARKLLHTIAVERAELESAVFADLAFRGHQARKTSLLKARAARGDAHARAILKDARISDGRGNWRGDLEEAIQQLHGAHRPSSWGRSRKYGILRAAGLMCERGHHDDGEVLYVYPRRYHKLFLRARALAGE